MSHSNAFIISSVFQSLSLHPLPSWNRRELFLVSQQKMLSDPERLSASFQAWEIYIMLFQRANTPPLPPHTHPPPVFKQLSWTQNGTIQLTSANRLAKLTKRVWTNSKLTQQIKIHVYRACVMSTPLYDSESWTLHMNKSSRPSTCAASDGSLTPPGRTKC